MTFNLNIESDALIVEGDALISKLLIDSFEDGDHAEYTDTSGDYYVVKDSTVAKHDSYYLDFAEAGQHSGAGLVSTSGLPRYPSPGNTFESHSQLIYSADFAGIQFACQTESDTFPDGYRCQVDGEQDRIEIIKHTGGGGTFSTLNSSAMNVSNYTNEWLRHKVFWDTNGDIVYTVYDSSGSQITQTSANDTTYTSGGFGYASETNSSLSSEQHVYHDYANIID